MDPDHPSNKPTEGAYGVEKDMATLADEVQANNGQYQDIDQGW